MRPDHRGVSRAEPHRRPDDPADRARDARGHGARAENRGAPPRRGHRARRAAGSRAQPGGARVLPRRGDGGLMLSVQNLELFYGDARALDGVSLEVGKDEIVAIVGANGAGKSSLIRSIAGIEIYSGTVRFN